MDYGSVSAAARDSHPLATGSSLVFQLLACNLACLTIAALYYSWRDVYLHRRKREQLHDRGRLHAVGRGQPRVTAGRPETSRTMDADTRHDKRR